MTLKQIVQQWVEAFNNVDVESLANLYHIHAINHQVVSDPLEGRDAIITMFSARVCTGKDGLHCREYI